MPSSEHLMPPTIGFSTNSLEEVIGRPTTHGSKELAAGMKEEEETTPDCFDRMVKPHTCLKNKRRIILERQLAIAIINGLPPEVNVPGV